MKHYEAVKNILEIIYINTNENIEDYIEKFGEAIANDIDVGLAHGYSVQEQVRIISEYYKYIYIITHSNGVIN